MKAGPGSLTTSAPLYVAWEITRRCNARCVHCYSDSGPEVSIDDDLPTDVALDVVDQLAEAGVLVLAFSGGEPLVRGDWDRLVDRAVRRGLSVNVGSNGATMTEANVDRLRELGVRSVTVSLDSWNPSAHDEFRRCPGLFDRAIRGIERLVARGIRVVVGFTPTRLNWADGPGVVRLASQLGASAANLSEYVPAGRGTTAIALAPSELHGVLQAWIALRKEYKGRLDVIWHDCRVGMLVPEEEKREYVGCGAGRFVARICANGDVTPCVFLPTTIGSLRQSKFKDLWARSALLDKFRTRLGHIHGNCGECQHLNTCGGCRAVAFAYGDGDALAGDPHCWIDAARSPDFVNIMVQGAALPL